MRAFRAFFYLPLFLLAACEVTPPAPFRLEPVGFEALSGWATDTQAEALAAFRKGCARLVLNPATTDAWREACAKANAQPAGDDAKARTFFEANFTPHRVLGEGSVEGLFTGYYEAELNGARQRDSRYRIPVYTRPADLVMVNLGRFRDDLRGEVIAGRVAEGELMPYPTRGEIEAGALEGKGLELLWVDDPVDLFFLHVQGSGRVRMKEGGVLYLSYAGKNGHPYRSIGRALIEENALPRDGASMAKIRAFLAAHPERMQEVFAKNPSFVFFKLREGEAPIGSLGAPLTPGRSLAVDVAFLPLGAPVWLDTKHPIETAKPLRRLVIAQDTGGAIKGPVRGDFFWGAGQEAESLAGAMRATGRYYLLLPKTETVAGRGGG